MRVALVSCVKTKRNTAAPAGDLYTSPLFLGLRKYAETHADRWFILSAKHGLLDPGKVIAPYEVTLNNMGVQERRAWAEGVKAQLTAALPAEAEVIVLAGERYREYLLPFLRESGHSVIVPLEGMPFGQQLQFLSSLPGPETSLETDGPFRLELPKTPRQGRTATPTRSFRDPVLSDLTSRRAVIDAIDEFDRLGREVFLDKYGFGPARRYFLEYKSRHYDSKAVVGAAYGFQHPDRGPLENTEFSGGRSTVQRKLKDLGFLLVVLPEA